MRRPVDLPGRRRVNAPLDKEALLVNQAFRDILRADFESPAVQAVMGRRAGTILEYLRLKDLYEAAVRMVLRWSAR